MYIPTSFFGSQGSCITASITNINGNGYASSGSFVSQSISWSYISFQTNDYTDTTLTAYTASLNILSGSTGRAKLLIVAGGGAGGLGNATDQVAGGGGAGGVVYYDNFPLAPGTYEIGVANAVGAGLQTTISGNNSYFKLPNNQTYTPFTNTSFITAYGGGGGGMAYTTLTPLINHYVLGVGGGSAGGAARPYGAPGATIGPYSGNSTQGGLNNQPQGYGSGEVFNTSGGSTGAAAGGGGASAASIDVTTAMQSGGTYVSAGGDGVIFNLTGTPITISGGGGGEAENYSSANGAGQSNYGGGGHGKKNGDGGPTPQAPGKGGIIIIAWPKCLF